MKRIIVLLLCCLFGLNMAVAQKSRISQFDQSSLPDQLLEYLNSATSKDDVKAANAKQIDAFRQAYSAMGETECERVTAIYNVLLKLKARPQPDVILITEVVGQMSQDGGSFDQWLAAVELLQSRNKKVKDVVDFAEFTQGLLKDRSLHKSKGSTWQTQMGAPFRFSVEGKDIKIYFERSMELYYSSGSDNGTIFGTTGWYDYFDSRWHGKGGRINWDRTGIPASKCWAVLNDYEAVVKFPKFMADSVQFTNTNYFSKPIYGQVSDALTTRMAPEKYAYPKFCSYQKDFEMKDVVSGVDYRGSFMMNGSKFVTSDERNPATMVFYRDGRQFITVTALRFSITSNKLATENAAVKIYIGEDSICNDGITVRYIVGDKKVTLINNSKRNYYSPYSDSYHAMDLYAEAIEWNMKDDKLVFSSLGGQTGGQSFSTFESANYYSYRKFRDIQGIDEVSPVMRVYKYIDKRGMTDEFFVEEFAQTIHMDLIQAKSMIHTLAGSGLVSYNEQEGKVYVKEKLLDYVRAYNKSKKTDYDAITLESATTGTNASLSLSTNDLQIAGVKKFVVSDSQQVAIFPRNGDVVVHKNRDLSFSGTIHAGRFIMYVTDALFSYKDFNLDLPKVDSVYFYVSRFDDPQKEHIVYTPLYHLVGSIQIDAPYNHNGLQDTKDFPIFESKEDSYVYYDRPDIRGGAYVRDKFYYTLHPFVLRNLVDFETDSLVLGGVLTSAGIFPDIAEPLKVQPDYSLGFVMETPKEGYEAYGGKGRYTSTIDLSYRGLRGRGKVDYLTSTTQSKNIFFMPDSMISTTDTFVVREEGGFPDIRNGRAFQHWFPYQDSMQVVQMKNGSEFRMYHDASTLAGSVTLRPQGASAAGRAYIREGSLESPHFTLATNEMDAKVSSFTLRSDRYRNTAFYANNIKSHVDYTHHKAEFVSNEPLGQTLLPVVQYAAYVDKFTWDMDPQTLTLINSKSEDTQGLEGLALRERLDRGPQPGARFVSTDPKQDSLQFYATQARYQYNDAQLSCRNVFLVHVADAVVAPSGDSLHVRAGGAIDLIHKAQILANTDSRYHLFYDADVMLFGAEKYSAKGTIDYVDEAEKHQKIYMTAIEPDAQGRTLGQGFVSDSANFTLNAALGFAGKVRVEADQQHYFFDGGVRLIHNCYGTERMGLLAFANYLDPQNIQITVPEHPTDWKGNNITASILFDRSTLEPHSAFLTNEKPNANELLSAWGFLTYDSKEHLYKIASAQKLLDPENVVDRILTLNTETCVAEGEGPLNLCVKQGVATTFAYGTATVDPGNAENTHIRSLFGVNFPMAEEVVNALARQIEDDLRLSPANSDNDILRHALIYYLGEEKGEEAYSEYVATGSFDKLPKEFENTLMFEQIDWQYSSRLGFYYDGVVPLSSVGKHQLHLATRLKAQINKRGNSINLTLYLQIAPDHWYYFNYESNSQQLQIQSSVGEWEDMIKALDPEKRAVEKDNGTFRYRISSSRSEVPNFLVKFGQGSGAEESEDDE